MSGGLIPNGEGTLQISDLSWPKLVIVAPPKKTAAAPKAPVSQGLKASDKPFDFTSVTQLPKKYQNPKFEEWEMDVVNGGGAGLLI
jgi:small subunit ribosomal protein YMR-31